MPNSKQIRKEKGPEGNYIEKTQAQIRSRSSKIKKVNPEERAPKSFVLKAKYSKMTTQRSKFKKFTDVTSSKLLTFKSLFTKPETNQTKQEVRGLNRQSYTVEKIDLQFLVFLPKNHKTRKSQGKTIITLETQQAIIKTKFLH